MKSTIGRFGFVMSFVLALAIGGWVSPTHAGDPGFSPFGDSPVTSAQTFVVAEPLLAASSVAPGKQVQAALKVTISPGWHINSNRPYADWLIPAQLTFDSLDGIIPGGVVYPHPHDVMVAGEPFAVYDGTAYVRFTIAVASSVAAGEYTLPLYFQYQPCNDKECRAPQTEEFMLRIVVGEDGTALHPEVFATATESGGGSPDDMVDASAAPESDLTRLIEKYGFWGYFIALGLAFVTGLLLSFSPCTYPMIPITVSIFAGQQRSVGRGFVLSLFYVGSMAVMYGLMGLIVSLVGGVFGAWLASTPVVIGIAVVFVIFSLSMFGLYELQVPAGLRNKLGAKASGGGVLGSIILGIIAALVVSPCVGPFVAGILLYVATSGSPFIGFMVLFVFAIGLGALYIIIGTFSSSISSLPGAGEWMEQVKKFFGFVLLLMAIYFLRTIVSPEIVALVTGLLLLALGVFGGGLDRLTSDSGFFPRLKKFIGIISLIVGIYLLIGTMFSQGFILPSMGTMLPAGGTSGADKESLIDWHTDLASGLEQARLESKPVLIDTWATWCANCRVLEKETFGNPDVAREAERFFPIKVQLETAGSPETRAFMKRFNMAHYSLPTTLLLDADGNVKKVLQGVVSPEDMIAEMQKVR